MADIQSLRNAQQHKGQVATPATTKPLKPAKAKKPKKGPWKPPSAEQRDQQMQQRGRLPTGSRVFATWDGEQWHVTLMVGPEGSQHATAGSGLFKTIQDADDTYRKSLEK